MSNTSREIKGQPDAWAQAVAVAVGCAPSLPEPGAPTLVVGCGTSAFVALAMARLREDAGLGSTDWAYASELPCGRQYAHVIAVTRSGTTTEVLQALTDPVTEGAVRTCVTAVPEAAAAAEAERVIDLSFADEVSVVQTRFPTTVLALWRAVLGREGDDLGIPIAQARAALAGALPVDATAYEHFVFLGHRWTLGLAHEAALKMRESAQAWAESYPALDYRHGPISVAGRRTLVVSLGGVGADVLDDVRATGASVLDEDVDPLTRLVTAQRLAVAAAEARGLDVDRPRNLSRSVILTPMEGNR